MKKRCYIYTRVSTAAQIEGYSLEAQTERLREYAAYRELEIAGEYCDAGKSGRSIKGRPAFQQMLDDIESEKDGISFVLVFKHDKATIDAINATVDAAIEEGIAKFGGKKPNKAAIKLPLRDGDVEREDEAYKGHYFVNANSNTPPQIVDRAVKPILDRSEVYSGYYARVSLSFYAFNSNGNKGVACGLGNIQKVRDGEPLGGRTNAADDFATLDDDDFLS